MSFANLAEDLELPGATLRDFSEPLVAALADLRDLVPEPRAERPGPGELRNIDNLEPAAHRQTSEPLVLEQSASRLVLGTQSPNGFARRLGSDSVGVADYDALRMPLRPWFSTSDVGADIVDVHDDAVLRRGGEPIFLVPERYVHSVVARADHSVVALVADPDGSAPVLMVKPHAGPIRNVPVRLPEPALHDGYLFWDQLLLRTDRHVWIGPLDAALSGHAVLQPRFEATVGARVDACRTLRTFAIRVGTQLVVRGHDQPEFSAPMPAPAGTMSCHDDVTAFVDTDDERIVHAECTEVHGCTVHTISLDVLDRSGGPTRRPDEVRAVDLQGKLLVLWTIPEHGGLRLRVATPDTFAGAQDQIVFDDGAYSYQFMPGGTLRQFQLVAGEHAAVLALNTSGRPISWAELDTHVFRIDAGGAVSPI